MHTWVIFALLSVIVATVQQTEAAAVREPAFITYIDKVVKKGESLLEKLKDQKPVAEAPKEAEAVAEPLNEEAKPVEESLQIAIYDAPAVEQYVDSLAERISLYRPQRPQFSFGRQPALKLVYIPQEPVVNPFEQVSGIHKKHEEHVVKHKHSKKDNDDSDSDSDESDSNESDEDRKSKRSKKSKKSKKSNKSGSDESGSEEHDG